MDLIQRIKITNVLLVGNAPRPRDRSKTLPLTPSLKKLSQGELFIFGSPPLFLSKRGGRGVSLFMEA
jgi:hypothetical protein